MIVYRNLFLFSLIFAILVLPSCWGGRVEKKKDLAIVNVLDKEEFDDCHIAGSISIPLEKIKSEAEKKIDKNADVVLYCSNYMCASSGIARKHLMQMGYKKVFVYKGGTAEWKQKGFSVVGPCKKGYLKIKLEMPNKKVESYVLTVDQLKAKIDALKRKA